MSAFREVCDDVSWCRMMALVRYHRVLRAHQVLHLVSPMVVGRLPNGMRPLGIVLLVHQQHGSYAIAGAALAALTIGTTGSAPFRGRAVDRWGQTRVLVALAVSQWPATQASASGVPTLLRQRAAAQTADSSSSPPTSANATEPHAPHPRLAEPGGARRRRHFSSSGPRLRHESHRFSEIRARTRAPSRCSTIRAMSSASGPPVCARRSAPILRTSASGR